MIRTGMQEQKALRAGAQEPEEYLSLCSFTAGTARFGIDTHRIREVLGRRLLQRVPLAPAYIGGIVPYRGEVLTTVSFRALLGLPPFAGESAVLVLEDCESGDRGPNDEQEQHGTARESFGLMVDAVGGVVTVARSILAANPATLDERSKTLFDGAFRMPDGLLIRLDPGMLRPARLGGTGLFRHALGAATGDWGAMSCVR
ncbi:purine-binding chemotaxis protein CheW [Granulicella rosea]|uniref:Purine-binding chemotaxis protein CheW n=1 Tax=Granulicella rosea TaxID=474952 RepID=A0A239DZ95_9BACT|nr:chemotaxis protein CheW [Granulicella rosea]SNS37022.1 purine-binding chemotaxis protein CheW [Granulicella rosea]